MKLTKTRAERMEVNKQIKHQFIMLFSFQNIFSISVPVNENCTGVTGIISSRFYSFQWGSYGRGRARVVVLAQLNVYRLSFREFQCCTHSIINFNGVSFVIWSIIQNENVNMIKDKNQRPFFFCLQNYYTPFAVKSELIKNNIGSYWGKPHFSARGVRAWCQCKGDQKTKQTNKQNQKTTKQNKKTLKTVSIFVSACSEIFGNEFSFNWIMWMVTFPTKTSSMVKKLQICI